MPLFRSRQVPSQPHECEYRESVNRVRDEMMRLPGAGSENASGVQYVSVAHVLDLLNPRGMWRHIRTDTEPMDKTELPGPDADPLTGCNPVTAPRPG